MEESKCKTFISTLESEIKDLQILIGEKAYEKWSNNESTMDEFVEMFQEIKEKYKEIEVQKDRIQQLSEEEKQIFGKGNQMSEDIETIFCGQCGTKNMANYKYCYKCGVPLNQ